jgi:WD40 repeat protein
VRVWDVVTRQQLTVYRGHQGPVTDLAFLRDGRTILSRSSDQTLKLWNANRPPIQRILTTNSTWTAALAFAPSGNMLVSTPLERGVLNSWDAATDQVLDTFPDLTRSTISFTVPELDKFYRRPSDRL